MKGRKLLSAVIAGAMVLGTMSFPAFAADTLPEAVDGVITLTEDVKLGSDFDYNANGGSLTIDLAGYSLKLTGNTILKNGVYTIKNGTVDVENVECTSREGLIRIAPHSDDSATLNMDNVTVKANGYNAQCGLFQFETPGKLNLNKVTINAANVTDGYGVFYSSPGNPSSLTMNKVTMTVTGANKLIYGCNAVITDSNISAQVKKDVFSAVSPVITDSTLTVEAGRAVFNDANVFITTATVINSTITPAGTLTFGIVNNTNASSKIILDSVSDIGTTEGVCTASASIGSNLYSSLADALAAASEGDTIYVYPVADGHDAFTIDKPLTIEGVPDENGNNPVVTINETTYGGVKYDAAVTLKNLDFIVDENATGSTWCQSAVGYYYENAQNRNNSSFINCNFVNNSSLNLMAIFACYSTLTVKDCTFTNFDTAIATMLDGGTLDNVAVTGNTFNAVDTLYTGYWGSSSASSNIEITNNAVNSPKSDDAVPQIIIGDYSFELGNGLGVANININNTYNTPTEFVANSISNQSNIVKDANITMVKSFRNADVAAAAGTLAEGEKFYLNYGSPTLEKLVTYSTQGVNLDEANTITIKLDETDEDGVYDIKLNGNGIDIYEFVGAEFTFENTSETVGGSYMAYEVSGISGQTEVTKDLTIPDKYAISLAAGADRISGAEITIGQVKFIGQGTINFSVIDGTVVTTKYNTHLERYYSVADNNLEYGTGITDGSVEADVRNIVVNVNYAHALVGSWTDNQMTVTLKNAFGETSDAMDISDGEEAFADVPVGRITVTLKAPGFRTFTYTTTVEEGTDPLVLSFWNDTKRDTAQSPLKAIEAGKAPIANNFVVGDIAMDYIVDKYDLAAVTSYYGTYGLTDTNKIKYDLNRDGDIDITDVAYVLHNFGF